MKDTLYHEASRTTAKLLRFMLDTLPHPPGRDFRRGLPAGSMHLEHARLVMGGTPCTVPMFHGAMERTARDTRCDVLVARHGTHPEVLDPVLWDAVVWSGDTTMLLTDFVLWAGERYWLVPTGPGPFLRLAPNGVHIEFEPDFLTWHQRCDGVCEAAQRIIRATRGGIGAR